MKRVAVLAAACVAWLAVPRPAPAGVRPVHGGELRVALPAAPRVLDPARALEPEDLVVVRTLHAPLLDLDASGRLMPGLLAEVPPAEAGGRTFRLRLRSDAAFAAGTPVVAADVAAALARVLRGPHAWIALPIVGADAVLAGRAEALAGVRVVSERELVVTLAFPVPDFAWALAAPASAPVAASGAGAGPFRPDGEPGSGPGLRLVANDRHHGGRPFADALVLVPQTARGAAAALGRGDVHVVLRPEAAGPAARALAPAVATYAVVNRARLGAAAEPLRAAIGAVDRDELVRRFVRGPAEPLEGLLPRFAAPPDAPERSAPARAAAGRPPARATILVPAGVVDAGAVADRLQVLLFDGGLRVGVERAEADAFAARVVRGDYDVALVPVTLGTARPALAAAQVALQAAGPRIARDVLERLGALPPEAHAAALARLGDELGLVPLYATGLRVTAAPEVQGLVPTPDGGVDLAGAWRFRAGGAP